ncbi:MAG TPA: phosphoenolpyruvate--protein phosphotransferase, partial [Rhodocyclaceae bacterium]|nr:phosphoenolpyruvate--protein phosphotransferase [Rhodocyclaceae bacterium]
MTFSIFGLAVSQGIAIGRAHLVSHALLEVAQYQLRDKDVPAELLRLDAAFAAAKAELESLREEASAPGSPSELVVFLDLHTMILADPMLVDEPRVLIKERRCNAEWALVQQMQQVVAQFEAFDDPYLRERKQDVVQVVERVIKALQGKPRKLTKRSGKDGRDEDLIVVAHDLSPADTIQFKNLKIGGFVTDLGGATSHTAIVARSLAIPAVVGMNHARPLIQDDDLLIVDGTRGALIIDPDERILEEYRLKKTALELERSKRKRLKTAKAATLDGVEISLQANIELPQDMADVKAVDADGVGLFRTEFLFMNRDDLPDEDEQFEAYKSVAKAMGGKPVTIRTLDIGADKEAKALRGAERIQPNPALGLRAIRYCLAEPQIFLAQLRAILRASHYGKVRLLIPMLAHASEVDQALVLIETAKTQLRNAKLKFDEAIEIGGMVEVPAAALALGPFLRKLDFLSIGTNDLIQYTLAIDRTDEAVAHLYDPLHPAVLRLISLVIQTGQRAGLSVSVCGEMAGDPRMTRLLLGMGLRVFSMHPAQILEIKQNILMADAAQLVPKVNRLLRFEETEKI